MALPYLPPDTRQRTFKERTKLDSLTDYEVRKHCAMPLENVRELFELISPGLKRQTARSKATLPETQLLSTLSFFRSGSFQYIEGSVCGVSQSTVSLNLDRVCNFVCNNLLPHQLQFPVQVQALNRFKEDFFEIGLFPNVVGVIDGSHVNIKAPHSDEPMYINRKGLHSINVQLVCSPNQAFTDAVVKWPGATHDSFMWNNCGLKSRFENGDFGESWLIGN